MNVLGLSQPYMWMTIKTEKKKMHTLYGYLWKTNITN